MQQNHSTQLIKTDHIDAAGALIRTVSEAVIIEISTTEINVSVDGDPKMKVIIKSNTCNWTVPFKTGKTVIHGAAQRDGNSMPVTLTIEGKDGKITPIFQMDEHTDDKVRLSVDKFAAKE